MAGYANWTVLHEIGHSLGLKHTHRETSGTPALAVVGKYMDNERYSVMSYNGASNADDHGHAVSFMALDIAALQALYGAETYNGSSSTYMLTNAKSADLIVSDDFVQIGRAYYCIWDSGGNDAISYASLNKSVIINLNDATLDTSRIAPEVKAVVMEVRHSDFFRQLDKNLQQEIVDPFHHAGGFFSRVLNKSGGKFHDIDGGFSIAYGAQIENGTGGAAADMIIGNEGANTLSGNSGADRLFGSGGMDLLFGDTQNDLLDGGKGNDFLNGGDGRDTFVFSKGYGLDQIELFQANDRIDLSGLAAITNFNDLIKHHIIKHSDGIEIHAGADSLILFDAKMSDLNNSDFIFR